MVVALVAEGPNSVRIPMMFWSDYDTALAQATNLLGPTYAEGRAYWCIHKEHYSQEDDVLYFFIGSKADWQRACEQRPVLANIEHHFDDEAHRVAWENAWSSFKEKEDVWIGNLHLYLRKINLDALFTSYYGGCGECGGFSLEIFEEGKPCVPFNLD